VSGDLEFQVLASPFGVMVHGITWEPPSDSTVERLTIALRRHLLLLLRGHKPPTHAELDGFFSAFGPLVAETYDGEFHRNMVKQIGHTLSKERPATRLAEGVYLTNEVQGGNTELVWHHDMDYRPQLKVLSVLEAAETSPGVVPTCFRDVYTAFETMPSALRHKLDSKQAVYFDRADTETVRLADAMHLAITPHPHSRRKSIFISERTARIAGMPLEESTALLEEIRAHIDRMAPTYTHEWESGDICVWDNIGVQHRRDAMPAATGPGDRRIMRVYEGVAE
jgi:taurine dioxygenase